MDIAIHSLAPQNVDAAHVFLTDMSSITPGLCTRPIEAMRAAAQKSNRGQVALRNDSIAGLTVLYDTVMSGFVESGSTCVLKDKQGNGLGRFLLASCISAFYADEANREMTIIADVFQINPHVLRMVLELGFKEIEPPVWYDRQRQLKGSNDQIAMPYHCISMDRGALECIHALYPELPPQKNDC